MATYVQLYSECLGYVPKLSKLLARNLVNRALRDIYQKRLWSSNLRDGQLISPSIITAGTVTVTQYSNAITFDANAIAALNTLGFNPPVTSCQFRIGSSGGPVYSIYTYNTVTGAATLDRNYGESTGSGQAYQVYRCYYAAPDPNFERWESIYDPIQGYWLRLHYSKTDFDRWDPQRGAQLNPVYVGRFRYGQNSADTSSFGIPMFEMWPHPTARVAYQCLWITKGPLLVNDGDTQPYYLPDDLIQTRARWRCYEWAEANKGSHPELKSTNWRGLMADVDALFKEQWLDAARMDEEVFLMNYKSRSLDKFPWPNTGQFLASHDVGEGIFQ